MDLTGKLPNQRQSGIGGLAPSTPPGPEIWKSVNTCTCAPSMFGAPCPTTRSADGATRWLGEPRNSLLHLMTT